MLDALPIKILNDEDAPAFGKEAISLGKLSRLNFPVGNGIVVSPPNFKLNSILEHFDFSQKEIFEQSLTLFKKEVSKIPIPENLEKELRKNKKFLFKRVLFKSKKELWISLLNFWMEEIKMRIWNKGFYPKITEELSSQIVNFVNKLTSAGEAFFDSIGDDVVIRIFAGKIHPQDQKKLCEIVIEANKKLFIPFEYEWILDGEIKLVGIKEYTPSTVILNEVKDLKIESRDSSLIVRNDKRSAIKVFYDFSKDFTIEKNIDGIFIASEKIYDLNIPRESLENLIFRIVEASLTFSNSPVLIKLADKSEGMGKVRGTLRLLHQKNLFDPITEAISFARHKKNLTNVHIVIPFIRGVNELLQIKRELATKKLMRKNSLQLWMEICIPENIINLEDYLMIGLDGVVLNLDELVSFLNGFDNTEGELITYKNEVAGLLSFLADGLKLLNKSKVPFIATGSLCLYPEVLEFLVEKGVYGVVVEKYEAHSAKDLLHQTEKRMILKRAS